MSGYYRPCLVLTHIPSGISIKIEESYRRRASSHIARDLALKILKGKLWVLKNEHPEFNENDIKYDYDFPDTDEAYLKEASEFRKEI